MFRRPIVPPDALRCLRLPVPSAHGRFAPFGAPWCTEGRGLLLSAPLSPLRLTLGWKRSSLPFTPFIPSSWGDPYVRALFSDPGGTFAPGHYDASVRPSVFSTTSAPAFTVLSRLHHTAHTSAVYASQDGSLHHHARLASGCGQLCRTGCFLLQGPNERFQQSIASSFPKLSLAQAKRSQLQNAKPLPEKYL